MTPRSTWSVRQTFETLGDPCSTTHSTEVEAEQALATLRAMVAQMVAEMQVFWQGPEWTGYPREHEAWEHALALAGVEFDDDGNQTAGPAKYGPAAGEHIAGEACEMEQGEAEASRHYYAIAWRYGRAVDDQGRRIGTVQEFATQAERSAWIAAGPDLTTAPGYREALTARDVRRDECGELSAR
jgi:hypothetical protein